jgi:hypothetical protein
MSQTNTTPSGLTVKSAIRAGRLRADQPDPPNRRKIARRYRLTVSQFGVNAHGVATFTKA